MRKELEEIALIEAFLEGKVLRNEVNLENASELIIEQKTLVQAVKESAIRGIIVENRKLWNRRQKLYKSLLFTGILAIIIAGVWFAFNQNKTNAVTNPVSLVSEQRQESKNTVLIETPDSAGLKETPCLDLVRNQPIYSPPSRKNNHNTPTVAPIKNDTSRIEPTKIEDSDEEQTPSILQEQASQTFTINPTLDTIIVGEKGTKIFFPAYCFADKTGSVNSKPITIKLREFYTKWDFLKSDLTCETNDERILESGGMIELEASSVSGKKLVVSKSSSYYIQFNNNDMNEMQIFYESDKKKLNGKTFFWELGEQTQTMQSSPNNIEFKKSSKRPLKPEETGWGTKFKRENNFQILRISENDKNSVKVQPMSFHKEVQSRMKLKRTYKNSSQYDMIYISYQMCGEIPYTPCNFTVLQSSNDSLGKKVMEVLESSSFSYIPLDYEYENSEKTYIAPISITGKKVDLELLKKDFDSINQQNQNNEFSNVVPPIVIRASDSENNISKNKLIQSIYPLDTAIENSINQQNKRIEAKRKKIQEAMNKGLESRKLRWINCDRFINDRREKISISVEKDNAIKTILFFKNINSAMRGIEQRDNVLFSSIPFRSEIEILQVKANSNGDLLMRIYSGFANEKIIKMPEWIPYEEKKLRKLYD